MGDGNGSGAAGSSGSGSGSGGTTGAGGPAAGAGSGGAPGKDPDGSGSSTGSAGAGVGNPGSSGSSGTPDAMPAGPTEPTASAGGSSGAGGDPWASCAGNSFKPGISAMVFCTKYMSACSFGAGDRYASMADCMTKYSALTDGDKGGKACAAWYLCVAATPDQATTHCPTAPNASKGTGPCKPAYL